MQVRLTYKLVSEENGWDLKKRLGYIVNYFVIVILLSHLSLSYSFSDHQNTRVTCEIVQSVQGIGGSWGPGLIKRM